jgi:hypothetical protein
MGIECEVVPAIVQVHGFFRNRLWLEVCLHCFGSYTSGPVAHEVQRVLVRSGYAIYGVVYPHLVQQGIGNTRAVHESLKLRLPAQQLLRTASRAK